MPRGSQLPGWWRVVEAVEDHMDMERRHRADGVLTEEEDQAERRHLRLVVLGVAVDSADALSIAQAVARGGPECQNARRMLAARGRRRAENVVAFPDQGTDPDGGPAAAKEAA